MISKRRLAALALAAAMSGSASAQAPANAGANEGECGVTTLCIPAGVQDAIAAQLVHQRDLAALQRAAARESLRTSIAQERRDQALAAAEMEQAAAPAPMIPLPPPPQAKEPEAKEPNLPLLPFPTAANGGGGAVLRPFAVLGTSASGQAVVEIFGSPRVVEVGDAIPLQGKVSAISLTGVTLRTKDGSTSMIGVGW